jgi:hypothetical protein
MVNKKLYFAPTGRNSVSISNTGRCPVLGYTRLTALIEAPSNSPEGGGLGKVKCSTYIANLYCLRFSPFGGVRGGLKKNR